MSRGGPGTSPLVLFSFSMICISTLFILYSPTPFKIPTNHNLPNDDDDDDSNDVVLTQINAEHNESDTADFVVDHDDHVANDVGNDDVGNVDERCDLSDGRWIPDMRGSAYTNWTCPTIPTSKNCFLNGREDRDFVNWRWKPEHCDLPRFDPRMFLRIMRNKKLAFVGDSVARNHMESLLCLLSQEETPEDKYKDSEDRFRTWHFPQRGFTLSVLWTKFLVAEEERLSNGSGTGVFNLHLDKIDPNWGGGQLADVEYIVLSDAHWFFRKLYIYKSSKLMGCIYCDDKGVKNYNVDDGLRMALRAALVHIKRCRECKEGMVSVVSVKYPTLARVSWSHGFIIKWQSFLHKVPFGELEHQVAAIRAIRDIETNRLLTSLRLLRSYFTEEQLQTPLLEYFEHQLPNLSISGNGKEEELNVNWKTDLPVATADIHESLLRHISLAYPDPDTLSMSNLHFSTNKVQPNSRISSDLQFENSVMNVPSDSQLQTIGFQDGLQTPVGTGNIISFGMTPKTLRLPKKGEILLSVHGSPLGVFREKEDNMEVINETEES